MFPTSKAVKSTAKENLKGRWAKNSCAALIPVVLIMIFSIVGELMYSEITIKFAEIPIIIFEVAAAIFVVCPVMLGTVRFFRNFSQDKDTELSEIFFYFSSKKDYFRSFSFILNFSVRIAIIGFAFMLPSFLTDMAYHGRLDFLTGDATPLWFNDLWIVSVFLRGLAVVGLLAVMFRYYLAPFIFASNDSVSAAEAIHLSACASKIGRLAFLSLLFSNIFWIIISFLIIPLVFTLPYLLSCYTSHCNFAVYHYNKALKMKNSKETFDPDFDI